jgi:opacity protein-like surface antigen
MRFPALFAMLAIASLARAQDSLFSTGPSANLHLAHASGSTITSGTKSATTGSSTGWGLTLGYGIRRWFGLYMTADAAGTQSTVQDSLFSADLSLYQADAGLRFQWPVAKDRVVPFALIGFSYRLMSGNGTGKSAVDSSIDVWGPAFSYGLGVDVFLSPRVALDLNYVESSVKYRNINGSDTHAGPTPASRVDAGITWQIGPVGPPLHAPSEDTLAVGERAEIRTVRESVRGSVVSVRLDTIIVQQLHHDTATQIAVPRACITSAARELPSHAASAGAVNGAFIGGIAISLLGVLVQENEKASVPPKTGHFLAHFTLPGAIIGAAVGAVVGNSGSAWEPLRLDPAPVPDATSSPPCRAWRPTP